MRSPFPVIAASAALALALVGAPSAGAASAAPRTGGWVRIAHLSPDTDAVDVTLTAVSGGATDLDLDGIGYGEVSAYRALPDGTYAVAMRPAGAAASTPPVLSARLQVAAGRASTLAVFGRNADLQPRILSDDLTPPRAGAARVRLIQASTRSAPVSVSSSDGTRIATDATSGSTSGYASVPAGSWRLTTRQAGVTRTSSVRLKAGQVVSLFVLDDADGGTVVRSVVDAAGTASAPKGYLATGGGFLARRAEGREHGLLAGGAALLLALLVGARALAARRRRPARA